MHAHRSTRLLQHARAVAARAAPRERVRDRLAAYAAAGVTTLTVSPTAPTLEERIAALVTMGEILVEAGLDG
jgi:hypothetical protein